MRVSAAPELGLRYTLADRLRAGLSSRSRLPPATAPAQLDLKWRLPRALSIRRAEGAAPSGQFEDPWL